MSDSMNNASNSAPAAAMPAASTAPAASAAVNATPAQKSNTGKIVLIVLGVLLLCCVVVALGGYFLVVKPTADAVKSAIPYASSLVNSNGSLNFGAGSASNVTTASIGERKTADNFAYTVNSVKQDGVVYVIEIKVENLSSTDATFSTILQMDLVNQAGASYSQNFSYDVGENRLDGTVPANGSVTGKIAYTVDDNPSSLDLKINGGFLSKNAVNFTLK